MKSKQRLLIPDRKVIRSAVIADHVRMAGYEGAVIFSCGNASRALKATGIYTVDVSASGDLEPRRWWQPWEIHKAWPLLLDATSGHLGAPLMMSVARAIRDSTGRLPGDIVHVVPTGSGETIACLRWVYPGVEFEPLYDCGPGTEYSPEAPLNEMVKAWP